jgi:hypothetical protein
MATTGEAQATQIAKAARRLHQEAKGHTKLANQHRNRAATLHRDVEELKNVLAAAGIKLEFDD